MESTSQASWRSPIGLLAVSLMVLAGCVCSAAAPATAGRSLALKIGASSAAAIGRIAYSGRDGRSVLVRAADGSSPAVDVTGRRGGQEPSWSPDGRKLAFSRPDYASGVRGGGPIWVVNADGTAQRRLTSGRSEGRPVWSPDGKWIAFLRFLAHGRKAIDVVSADGATQRTLATTFSGYGPSGQGFSWSPDGRRLAVQQGCGPILIVRLSDGRRRGLPREKFRACEESPFQNFDPAWSPDGKRIVFGRNPRGSGAPQLWIVNADGSGLHRLSRGGQYHVNPQWSPDGRRIAYQTVTTIGIFNADGSDPHLLPHDLSGPFAWSPDSTSLAVVAPDGSLVTIDATGRSYHRLARGVRWDPPVWTR
jgi:TolB protein